MAPFSQSRADVDDAATTRHVWNYGIDHVEGTKHVGVKNLAEFLDIGFGVDGTEKAHTSIVD